MRTIHPVPTEFERQSENYHWQEIAWIHFSIYLFEGEASVLFRYAVEEIMSHFNRKI